MPIDWEQLLGRIRRDRRSGAGVLVRHAIRAARLFLAATRHLPPARLPTALRRFTLDLVIAQPSMAACLRLANALWLGSRGREGERLEWEDLRAALDCYTHEIDHGLGATVQRAAALVRPRSLILTYSNSTAVRMALWRAMAAGRRFEVVCSESRPMREGVTLARDLAALGIPVHLVVDAALAEWLGQADLVLLGADAILSGMVVNKVGTEHLLRAARRADVPGYVLADSSKWLPDALAAFWRVREEAPEEIARLRYPSLAVHNRYFGMSPLAMVTGVVWEDGVARPGEVRRRIARLPVSEALVSHLVRARAAGILVQETRSPQRERPGLQP